MAQQIFDSDINSFCRKFLVKTPGIPDPSAVEYVAEMTRIRKTLFENLLLFDKIFIKIYGESIAIPLLIGAFGWDGLESLLDQGAIEFVLWKENVGWVIENIPGLDGMVSMMPDAPAYVDPEQSIDAGFNWMPDAPKGRKRRNFIKRVVPLFHPTEKNIAADALTVVRKSLNDGGLQHYGIPKIVGHADNLTALQKRIVSKCTEDLMEYEFLIKKNMTSFSNYRYFSPFWSSAERFKIMNRTVTGFSTVSEIEGLPDLKGLFDELQDPLKRLPEIRNTANARHFRGWLEKTAGEVPDAEMVKAYIDAISERKGVLDSAPRKLLKTVIMATVGMGAGAAATTFAGPIIGTGIGLAAAVGEKVAEFGTETALGLLDSFVLERVTKGRSPRMFFDDLSKLRQESQKIRK